MSESITEVIPILRENLKITENEAKILLPLYLGGNMTVGGISLYSDVAISTVERALKSLEKKGLVLKIEGVIDVYRSLDPSFGITDNLSALLERLEEIGKKSDSNVTKRKEELDTSVGTSLSDVKAITDATRNTLDDFESKMMDAVQSQIESMVNICTQVLSSLSQNFESTISQVDLTLEDDLGSGLLELQVELDKTQKSFQSEIGTIKRDLDKWLKDQTLTTKERIEGFNQIETELLDAILNSISDAFAKSEETVGSIAETLSDSLSEKTLEISNDTANSFSNVTAALTEALEDFENRISAAHTDSLESLKVLLANSRSLSSDEGAFVRDVINQVSESISVTVENIDSWKSEVSNFIENTSRSISTQLEQIASTDSAYLEAIKTSVSGYLDKVTSMLNAEYSALRNLSSSMITDLETYLSSTRNSVMNQFRRQMKSDQTELETSGDALQSEINKWSVGTQKELHRRLSGLSTDLDVVLNTESSEFLKLAENMNSRLKSSFNSTLSSATTRNDAIISGIKKSTSDFETSVGSKLNEIVLSFGTSGTKHYEDIQAIYEALENHLDKRVTSSVTTLSTLVEKAQKEIARNIDDQTTRIDDHAQGIRDEFHYHIEDMTTQFISLTQNLEATFNGLLSSQTIEARDLISSIHSEFRNAVKSEMSILEDDSLKLQQGYTSEIGLKVETVSDSISTLRKSLEEFVNKKRTEISLSMVQTLDKVESSVNSTQDSLKEMESGIIKQIGENIVQLSKEFEGSVNAARNQISVSIDGFLEEANTSLNSTVSSVKSTVETFITAQSDSKERYMTSTSKKIDALASKSLKSVTEKIESYQTILAKDETSNMKSKTTAREEVVSEIESHKSEVGMAIDAAAMSVNTAVGNVTSSLVVLGNKLNSDLSEMQNVLSESSVKAENRVLKRCEVTLEKIEQMATNLFKESDTNLKAKTSEFESASITVLETGQSRFNELNTILTGITSTTVNKATKELSQELAQVLDTLTQDLKEHRNRSKGIHADLVSFINGISKETKSNRDAAIERALQNVLEANQQSARKFESIGLSLKTQISDGSYRLIENLSGDISDSSSQISNIMTQETKNVNDRLSTIKQKRNESLTNVGANIDKALRRWSKGTTDILDSSLSELNASIDSINNATSSTASMISAIKSSGAALINSAVTKSWYLTGVQETFAHLADLALRAEKSIVISTPSLEFLDLKALNKVKNPRRRVLILPILDEIPEEIESLKGWRIWHIPDPFLLAVRDESEIVLSAGDESSGAFAIASIDESYLKLYHDFLGPLLTRLRIKST